MARTDVTLSLDDALLARLRAEGDSLSATVERALRRHLERGVADAGADRRWAEDNALAVEALAGGAAETAGL